MGGRRMKRANGRFAVVVATALAVAPFTGTEVRGQERAVDPDLPPHMQDADKEAFMKSREEHFALMRGMPAFLPYNPRLKALQELADQEARSAEIDPAFWTQIGPAPIPIPHLPFTVGRQHDEREPPSVITADLAIAEDEPHRLSRAHFSLIRDGRAILVRDLNSTLGTIVNGQPLGHAFPVDSAPLRQGENKLVAGGAESPFVFVVTLAS